MPSKLAAQTAKLLYIRDGLAISVLWQSAVRGFNAGSMWLDNVRLPTDTPTIPFLIPEVKLQPGAQLHFLPDRTKNRRRGHRTITLSCDILCFTIWAKLQWRLHMQGAVDDLTVSKAMGMGS